MHIVSEKEYAQIGKAVEEIKSAPGRAKKFWYNLGPGLTTGASDDDPSGIATYSQTGAGYGFQFLWLSLFTFPLMAIVQEMCARIGIVTGQGLAANIRQHYSRPVLYVCTLLLLGANTFNIGADLGAMAESVRLLVPVLPVGLVVVFFGLGSLLLQVFTTYEQYAKYLKYLALILLSYVLTIFFVHVDWSSVLYHVVIPSFQFTKDQIVLVCAILGTTISPYLFFWQTSQEVEEKILKQEKIDINSQNTIQMSEVGIPEEISKMKVDVWSGMFISNVVMFFIITVCSATLHGHGIFTIGTASDAANALRPFAGDFAYALFALGIIGTGMLAIPVLAGSAAYAVSECFGWRFGLYRKLKEAYAFYGVIALATVVGIILNFVGLDPIKALIYSAVANGVVAPVIIFLIVQLSNRKDLMGEYKNTAFSNWFGWITVFLMVLSVVGLAISFI
jgi:NRAMP (natural resistance-associated macrophage protein)-like metal ion transporter